MTDRTEVVKNIAEMIAAGVADDLSSDEMAGNVMVIIETDELLRNSRPVVGVAQRSKCPYCPAPPSQFTSLENWPGFVRCGNCECEFLLVPKADAIPVAPPGTAPVTEGKRKDPTPLVVEALTIAEDVLSRSPYSTAIWPNGMHPQTGIEKIRAALASLSSTERP